MNKNSKSVNLSKSESNQNKIEIIYKNNNKYPNHNIIKKKGLHLNLFQNKSMKCSNNKFHPINIFYKYKRNKSNNNEELLKNKQLLKKFLEEDAQTKINKNSNKIIKNNRNNNIENGTSSNVINKTIDTTSISSGNLLNIKNVPNNYIFTKNNYVHEINFQVNGNNYKDKK